MAGLLDLIKNGLHAVAPPAPKASIPSVNRSVYVPTPQQSAEDRMYQAKAKAAPVVKAAVSSLNKLVPGLGGLAHGITTGDWDPYRETYKDSALAQLGKPTMEIDPVTGKRRVNEENLKNQISIIGGFVNPGLSEGEGLSKIAEKISRLTKGEDIAKELTTAFPKLSKEQASHLGTRYSSVTDAAKISEDLENMSKAGTATRSPQAPDAPDEVVGRRELPSQTEPLGGAPEQPQQAPGAAQSTSGVSSSPLYRTLFEDSSTVGEKLRKALLSTTEYIQDSAVRVRKLTELPGTSLDDASNIYQKQTLYPGRVQNLVDEGRDTVKSLFADMANTAKKGGVSFDTLRKDVQDFLHSRHAPERNASLGDGAAGMTDAEAAAKQAGLKAKPHAEQIEKFADRLQTLNNKTLQLLHEGGVITEDLFRNLTEKYPNHVPLNRIMDETDDFAGALSGKGYDVRSTGIRRATGSNKKVSDVVSNIIYNYEQAVLRSQKNIVDNSLLSFVRKNPQLSDIFQVIKPGSIGKDFEGKPIMEKTDDPSIIQLFENGKKIWIKVKDEHLALALRGVNREKLGAFLNAIGSVTRLYSGLQTRFNPEFFTTNKVRDLQEAMIYAASQPGVGAKGALKVGARDLQSDKAVIDWMRGKSTPGAKLYAEMREHGGTTGGMGLSTRQQTELDVEALAKTAQSNPRKAARMAIDSIDNLNSIFEDSTRLSVYRTALERGLSKDRAAALAKESSINFNRMGKGGPVINALWMFSNASIQGSAKMIRAMANPKVAATVITAVGSAVAAVNAFNDAVDPDWRNKVTQWDRLNGLPVMLSSKEGDARYITIPVSWGLKPIKVFADYADDALSGQKVNMTDAATDFFNSIAEGYNPVGGTDPTSSITPTILDVPVEIARNKSWSGSKIRPDFDKNAPPSIQYFDSLRNTGIGKAIIKGTEGLARAGIEVSPADINYAYQQYIGGAGRAVTKVGNTLIGAAIGKLPPVSEFPLISRFYHERPAEEVTTATKSGSDIKDLEGDASKKRFYENQKVTDFVNGLKDMSDNTARKQAIKDLAKADPDMAKDVLTEIESRAAGLNGDEKNLKNASVETRAQFIQKQLDGKTLDEKKEILKNYAKKKILTKAVLERVGEIVKDSKQP